MYIVSGPRREAEITAFHEAGHALMAILLGYQVRKISIRYTYELHGYCQVDPHANVKFRSHRETKIKHLVLVAMSGIAAEVLSFGQFDVLGAADDMKQARQLLSSVSNDERNVDSYMNQCETQALFQLSRYWDPLCMIAHYLLAYGEIEGQEAMELVWSCGLNSSLSQRTSGLAI